MAGDDPAPGTPAHGKQRHGDDGRGAATATTSQQRVELPHQL